MERNKCNQMCGRCINMHVVGALKHQQAGTCWQPFTEVIAAGLIMRRDKKKRRTTSPQLSKQTQLLPSVWPVFKSALVATVCACQLAAPSTDPSSHSDSGLAFKLCTLSEFTASVKTCTHSFSICVLPVLSGESHDPASYRTKIALA